MMVRRSGVTLRTLCWLLAPGLALGGCAELFDYHGGGAGGATDGRAPDSAVDRGTVDGARDGPPAELAANDLPSDGPRDQQAIGDGAAIDLTASDGPLGDLELPPRGCEPSLAQPVAWWDRSMVVCEALAGTVPQCEAPALCAPAWQLCTASDYVAHGGAATAPGVSGAWLDACVVEQGNKRTVNDIADLDGACSPPKCDVPTTGLSHLLGGLCFSWQPLNTTALNAAVIAAKQRARIDATGECVYWLPRDPAEPLAAAVCCL